MKTVICLLAVAATLTLSGCVTREITLPGGVTYKSTHFLTNPTIGPVKVGADPLGRPTFSMESYNHEQTELAGKALEFAIGIARKP